MNKELIYDFHTHINDMDVFEKYYEYNIIPIVNCQSSDEYERLDKKISKLKENRMYSNYEFYFSIGIHPHDSEKYMDYVHEIYNEIDGKTSLIGEIGMDGMWCDIAFDIQEKVFIESLELAKKYNKTVILHTKNMEERIYNIIKDYDLDFVVHWYSCENFTHKYIDKGCYFTIGPAILNDKNVMYLAKHVPIDRMLIETDGIEAVEWLFNREYTPDHLRGILETVIEEISIIKGISVKDTYRILRENSQRLLHLK